MAIAEFRRFSISEVYDFLIRAPLIFLLIFTPLAFGAVEAWSVAIMALAVFFAIFCWFLKMVHQRELLFVRTSISKYIFLFIGLVLFSLIPLPKFILGFLSPATTKLYNLGLGDLYSSFRPLSIYAWQTKVELYKVLAYAGVFFLIVNNIWRRKDINKVLISIITMGSLLSIIGLAARYGPETLVFLKRSSGHIGSLGLFVNKNHMAGYLEMAIPLALGMILASTSRKTKTLLVFLSTVMMVELFLTQSRAGMASFLIAISLFIVLIGKRIERPKRALLFILVWIAIIILITISLGVGPLIERLKLLSEDMDRPLVFKDTLKIARDFPFFGVGMGNFQSIFPKYRFLTSGRRYIYAHNDYLQLLVEMGLLGLITVLTGGFYFFRDNFYKPILNKLDLQQRRDPYVVNMVLGCFVGLMSMSLHNILDFNMHIPANALTFTVIMAVLISIGNSKRQGDEEKSLMDRMVVNLNGKSHIGAYALIIPVFLISLTFPISSFLSDSYYAERPDRAIHFSPNKSESYYKLGLIYEDSGDSAQAAKNYKKAISLEPAKSEYHLQLGLLLDSEEELKSAILFSPMSSENHYHLGRFYLANGRAGDGLIEFKESLRRDNLYEEEVLSLIWGSRLIEADKKYGKIIEVVPSKPAAKMILAQFLIDKGLWDEARGEYRLAIAAADGERKVKYLKKFAIALMKYEEFDEASKVWSDYISFDGPDRNAPLYLARSYARQGNLGEAIEVYRLAVEKVPEKEYYDEFARALFERGDYEEAVQTWKKCIDISPKFFPAHYWLGESYSKLGRSHLAVYYYQEALKLKPTRKKIADKIRSLETAVTVTED